jgi:DtxR family Mn-dependent transcriptional regulator
VQRLFIALDRPTSCPHGFPIPEVKAAEVPVLPTLADAEPGDVVEVAISGDTHPDVVAFLETIGIRPGTVVTVRERHPFDGPIVVTVDDAERMVGNKLASSLYVSSKQGEKR